MCSENNSIIVFDIETTGSKPQIDSIIEIGAVKIVDDIIVGQWSELINPIVEIPENIINLTNITNEMIKDKPTIEMVLDSFIKFCEDSYIVGHNIIFDYSFIKANAIKYGYSFEKDAIDTLKLARMLLPDVTSKKLGALCEHYNINLTNAHRALHDAKATYELYKHLKEEFYTKSPELFIPQKIVWNPPEL